MRESKVQAPPASQSAGAGSPDSYADGLKTAVGLLARREHSRLEIQRKLRLRGIDDETAARIIQHLIEARYLSESRYAEAYITQRIQQGYGPVRIRAELHERGVDEAQIESVLEEAQPDWLACARRVREKKYGTGWPDNPKERARQMRFLQYRGYSAEQIGRLFRGPA